jgi:hypothetical protein
MRTKNNFSAFDISDISVIDFICEKITNGKYLTNLLFVNETLSAKGFETDNHQAYFFDSSVLVSDRELEGFLMVNMDGFHSNCMNNKDEMIQMLSWDSVNDIKYKNVRNDSFIDIITSQGQLTIKKEGSHSLKILHTFYKNVWKKINDEFKDEPMINWNAVWDMGINEVRFSSVIDYCTFDKIKLELIKEEKEEVKSAEAYAFVKAVLAEDAVMEDILNKYKHIFDKHIDFADDDGYTAMHYACWDNKIVILMMLIEFGANPNVLSPTNESPINMAVVSGHFDIVQFFVDCDKKLELNIEWEKRNTTENPFHHKKGSTLIREVVLNQHWDIFDLLINGVGPNLDVLTEVCSVGFEGETNFFLAIEKFYQSKNIKYDKERLETIRSIVESSSNHETKKGEDSSAHEITTKMLDDGYTGKGTYTPARGNKYVGEWKNSTFHGQGTYTYASGDKYVGEWKDNKRNGQGTYTYAYGDKYVGEWKNGKENGQGTYTYAEGAKYVGEFKEGKKNGQGTFTWADGDKYVGQWKDGLMHGQGTYTYANGTIEKGLFENDEFVGEEKEAVKSAGPIIKLSEKDASIWEIIQYEFINLDKESVVKKDFSEMILKKYPHIKKGTLSAQISIQIINERSRTNYAQCSKERVCGDDKFDFLFQNEDKSLSMYDKSKHGIWEIYKREDGKLDVRIVTV